MRTWGLRSVLVAIGLCAVVPALAFSGYLLWRFSQSELARAQLFLDSQTRNIAAAADSEFLTTITMLKAVASVSAMTSGDPGRIEATMRSVSERSGRPLVLSDATGRILFDTRPPGVPPLSVAPLVFRGQVFVSDVVKAGDAPPHAVVAVPVFSAGNVQSLATILTVADFMRVIQAAGTPGDWIVSVVDRDGIHLARSHMVGEFAGKPLVPVLVERIRSKAYSPYETISLEGIPLFSQVVRAPETGWHAAVGLPRRNLTEPMRRNVMQLVVAGLLVAGLTLVAVFALGRRFDGVIRQLGTAARDLGAGRPLQPMNPGIREAQSIGDALAEASRELARRAREVEEAKAGLERTVEQRTAELVEEMARRESSERQLRQVQRMESVGQLAGGIAHDFNNMLAVVLSSLELLERRLARGDTDVGKYVDGARKGADRAAALTRRLLAFSRQQALEPKVVECNKLVAEVSELLRRTIPESIDIETVLAAGLWRTHVDPEQLENALVNLAANARDAMPDGGRLTIETANAYFDDAYAAANPETVAGQYVMIAVTDTGTGMDPAVLGRAFEPFITTKPVGQGTGLGLAQVHGFIKQSGGHVKLYSEPGHGVTVRLYLPRWLGAEEAEAPAAARERPPNSGAGELILVVEDEGDVRSVTVEMLQMLGYRTRDVASPREALVLLESLDDVALLFTDIVMPGMNGRQLADQAVAARPGLKVLFATGYTRNAVIHNGTVDHGVQLITKPFTLEGLASRVQQVLRGA